MGKNGDEWVLVGMGVGVENYKDKKEKKINARENGGRPCVDVLSEVECVQ